MKLELEELRGILASDQNLLSDIANKLRDYIILQHLTQNALKALAKAIELQKQLTTVNEKSTSTLSSNVDSQTLVQLEISVGAEWFQLAQIMECSARTVTYIDSRLMEAINLKSNTEYKSSGCNVEELLQVTQEMLTDHPNQEEKIIPTTANLDYVADIPPEYRFLFSL